MCPDLRPVVKISNTERSFWTRGFKGAMRVTMACHGSEEQGAALRAGAVMSPRTGLPWFTKYAEPCQGSTTVTFHVVNTLDVFFDLQLEASRLGYQTYRA
jgi:hypothetical protein